MTDTIRVYPAQWFSYQGTVERAAVTLPAPPKGLDLTLDKQRPETAPSPRMVKGQHTWRDDKILRLADRRRDRG